MLSVVHNLCLEELRKVEDDTGDDDRDDVVDDSSGDIPLLCSLVVFVRLTHRAEPDSRGGV